MDENSSEKGPVIKDKPKDVEGPGFTMKDSASSYSSGPRASVTMRTGASNEEKLRRLHDEQARFESLSPEEKAAEWEREEIESAASWFESMLQNRDEYSETLRIKNNGKFDLNARFNSEKVPHIPIFEVFQPEDLYEFMQKLHQKNPQFNVQIDKDDSGQWIKYKVTKISK